MPHPGPRLCEVLSLPSAFPRDPGFISDPLQLCAQLWSFLPCRLTTLLSSVATLLVSPSPVSGHDLAWRESEGISSLGFCMHLILTVKFLLHLLLLLLSLICHCWPDGLCEALCFFVVVLLPYPLTLWTHCFFTAKNGNLETRGDSLCGFEVRLLSSPSLLCCWSSFSWHMWYLGPIWWWYLLTSL